MKIDKNIIDVLINEVMCSKDNDEIPVGAVIFDNKGHVISSGHNTRQSECNVLGHAEINAILMAEKFINDWRLDGFSMLVSLIPCKMCREIIRECRLDRVFFICDNKNIFYEDDNFEKYVDSELEAILSMELKNFFNNKR